MATPMSVVNTSSGALRGRPDTNGVTAFLGIPYGGSTAGTNRFRPPTAPSAWSGVRDASALGPSSPQSVLPAEAMAMFGGAPEPSLSEDCLVLNVWAPSPGDAGLPVLVYFHGGGHAMGSGSWPAYNGAAMAARGAVVVTVNHRLGILGYLALGDVLGPEYAASGIVGMLDLVAALEWVRDNIAGFGGDPANVTVFGESGGGSKVVTLMAMPEARGLFHRAAVMSGWYGLRCVTRDQAGAATDRALSLLGLTRERAQEVLEMPADRLVDVSATMGGIDSGLEPMIDGVHLTGQPIDAVRTGAAPDVPMVVGSTRDEYVMVLAAQPGAGDDEGALAYLRGQFGAGVDDVIDSYRARRPGIGARDLHIAIATDGNVRIPAIRLAEARLGAGGAPVFMYRFDWPSPLDPSLGAAHGLDVPFVFDTADTAAVTGKGADRASLAEDLCGSWVRFAAGGQPVMTSGLRWPAYTLAGRSTMLFDVPSTVADDPGGEDRAAWSGVL
jgi:para-nitrobenzyl esterase